jgi:outer membrane protein assembly factor BamB
MNDRRPVRRLWIPVGAVALSVAAVIALWKYPNPEFPNDYRSAGSYLAVILGVLVLAFWLIFLSGMRWIARFAALVLAVAVVTGVAVGGIDRVEFQGNMWPIVHWRWEKHTRVQHEATAQVAIPTEASATDFPEYRNRNRDGVVTDLKIDSNWVLHPPKKHWEVSVGGGYGGISVVGPSAVTIEQLGRNEAVVCYDSDTGKERWRYEYPALFHEIMGGDGPRTNPTIADGDVYAYGATGHLARLDGTTGKPKWTAETLEGRHNVKWGQSSSPLVYDRFVVVAPGRNRASMDKNSDPGTGPGVIAYDRDTGKKAWEAADRPAGYSSAQLATIDGVRQVLVFDGGGLGSYDPETGKGLWFHEWTQEPEANVAQPLVFDDGRVFISSGYGHGSAMLKVAQKDGKWSVEEEWMYPRFRCKFTSPVSVGGFIYGIDEARGSLTCLDAKTGNEKWKAGSYGNGQILLVGDLIVVGTETGKLALVEANPERHHEVATFQALPGEKNWNYLTIARGRAYVRNHQVMACYDLPAAK